MPWTATPPSPIRRDVLGHPVGPRDRFLRRIDSITNALTGFGTTNDKGSAGTPNITRRKLTTQQLNALFENSGYAKRIVNTIPENGTRKGWRIEDDTDERSPLAAETKRLQIRHTVCDAWRWGRLHGGALVLIVTDEDIPPELASRPDLVYKEPLDPERVKKILNLVVLDIHEFAPMRYEDDITNPRFRTPATYSVNPGGAVVSAAGHTSFMEVHASRVLYFPGAILPPSRRWSTQTGLDDSILQAAWDQIRNVTTVEQANAILASELKIDVMTMEGLEDMELSDQGEAFDARMQTLAKSKSLLHMLLLGKGETFTSNSAVVTGMKDLDNIAKRSLAAVVGLPQVVLFGDTPGGLNTDGDSHRKLLAHLVSSAQEAILRTRLEYLYELIYLQKEGPTGGVVPDEWSLEFLPLDERSETEQATLEKTHAETDKIRVDTGWLTEEQIAKSRHGGSAYGNAILQLSDEELDDLSPDGDANGEQAAAVRAELAAARARASQDGLDDEARSDSARASRLARLRLDANSVVLVIPVPEHEIARWLMAKRRAENILGEGLEDDGFLPHVTVLFLGQVPDVNLEELEREVGEAVAGFTMDELSTWPDGLSVFPQTENSEGRTPVFIDYRDAWGIGRLHRALLQRLAHLVTAKQFDKFHAHSTLGFIDRPVTPDEASALLSSEGAGEEPWTPSTLQLWTGDQLRAAWAFPIQRIDGDGDPE